ncbi:MAG: S1C family serine protease [Isosphaeraceae bacterium]
MRGNDASRDRPDPESSGPAGGTPAGSHAINQLKRAHAMKTLRMFRISLMAATGSVLLAPSLLTAAQESDLARESTIRESVVKISANLRYPEIVRPWTKQSPRQASGTGVVIAGKRILTNAHVVLYASQLSVESQQSSEKLNATVEAVSPGMDLAVLKLDDESFFEKRPPLALVQQLPEVKDTVVVYGYPQGGSSLSVTKGIVSRIEFAGYNDGVSGVRIQVDAAINPGQQWRSCPGRRQDGRPDLQQADPGRQHRLHHSGRGDRTFSQRRRRR